MAGSGIPFGDARHGDVVIDASVASGRFRPRVDLGGISTDASVISAFGMLLAQEENPVPNAQIAFPYNINDVYVTTATANGGTVTQANSHAVLQTSANVAGSAQLESRAAARYSPGAGQVVRFTAIFTAGVAGSQQEIGIGDTTDGLFFGYQGATFGIFRRQNGTDFFTPRTAWNVDKLDGSGPSGMTITPTVGNVYAIRYQWLGYGAIRFYVEEPLSGQPQLVHVIQYANANVLPTIFNPSLPLHARAVNSGNNTNLTLRTASMGVYTEGPFNSYGGRFSSGNRKTAIVAATNILTIRNDVTVFGGAPNRARLHIDALSLAITGNADAQVRMVRNAALGGVPAFAQLDAARSIVSVDVAGTTVTGGVEVFRIPSNGNFQQTVDISNLEIRLSPGETMTFAASSFGAGVAPNIAPAWHEEV